jgi:hypothetical protein
MSLLAHLTHEDDYDEDKNLMLSQQTETSN